MTLTAGVRSPSAMTQLAPYKVHARSAIRATFDPRIQDPFTGLPLRSDDESIVSDAVSRSVSECCASNPWACLSKLRYRLRSIYKTKVPPSDEWVIAA